MVPKSIQNWTRTAQKTRKNNDRNIKPNTLLSIPAPHFYWKSRQVGSKLGPKTEPKSKKNVSKNQCIFWCMLEAILGRILMDFGVGNGAKLWPKLEENWRWLKTQRKAKHIAKTNTKIRILDVRATFFQRKSVEKSIKKWSVNGKGSWCQFLINFGRFWLPSWGRKSKKNRYQRCWKKWWKKGCGKDGSRVAIWILNGAGGIGFRSRGRTPPFMAGKTPPGRTWD